MLDIEISIITYRKSIATCMSDSWSGFWLEIGFIDHLLVVTTSNYNSLIELHNLLTTRAHRLVFSFCYSLH
jgi:hypothetical protein